MNVPLIQKPETNDINASLIAIRKQLQFLNESVNNIENKYLLKSELKELSADTVGGDGKYIESISENNGIINAVEKSLGNMTPVDTVTSGNMQTVTSNAVANYKTNSVTSNSDLPVTSGAVAQTVQEIQTVESSLPTDAVLHYSFDEVPDYPDGTADVRLLNNNTYDIQSTSQMFNNNGGATFSNVNGNLQIVAVGDSAGVYITNASIENKIIKFKIKITSLVGVLRIRNGILNVIETITNVGEYVICYLHKNDAETNKGLYILCGGEGANSSCTFTVEQIYIGDGSYATPVIDNANGQNNATNYGGIAVKGVSGKGAYFLEGKYSQCDFNLTPNFTISVWVNPSDNASGKSRNIVHKTNQLILRNGAGFGDYLQVYLYGDSSALLNGANFGSLLPPNVWTHIVIVRNGLEFSMYKNSVKTRTITLADNTLRQNTEKFKVANEVNTGSQAVDDLLVFNRALSETEVKALYLNRANTPKYYSWADWKLSQV